MYYASKYQLNSASKAWAAVRRHFTLVLFCHNCSESQNACGEGCDERGEDGEGVIEVTEATEDNERAMGYWFVPPCSRQRGSQEQ